MIVWNVCSCVANAAATAGSTVASLIDVSCCWDTVRFDDLLSIVLRRLAVQDATEQSDRYTRDGNEVLTSKTLTKLNFVHGLFFFFVNVLKVTPRYTYESKSNI